MKTTNITAKIWMPWAMLAMGFILLACRDKSRNTPEINDKDGTKTSSHTTSKTDEGSANDPNHRSIKLGTKRRESLKSQKSNVVARVFGAEQNENLTELEKNLLKKLLLITDNPSNELLKKIKNSFSLEKPSFRVFGSHMLSSSVDPNENPGKLQNHTIILKVRDSVNSLMGFNAWEKGDLALICKGGKNLGGETVLYFSCEKVKKNAEEIVFVPLQKNPKGLDKKYISGDDLKQKGDDNCFWIQFINNTPDKKETLQISFQAPK